jgi:hypothetical protein
LKLVGEEPAVLLGHASRDVAEILWAGWRCVGRDYDLGAERRERHALIDRHLLWHHANQAVTACSGDQREAHAGVASRCFDQRHASAQRSTRLCVLDDRKRDAVLDRAARVHVLALDEHRLRKAARDALQRDERGASDLPQDGLTVVLQAPLPPIPVPSVSLMRSATTIPEAQVSAATDHIAAARQGPGEVRRAAADRQGGARGLRRGSRAGHHHLLGALLSGRGSRLDGQLGRQGRRSQCALGR